MLTRLWGIFRLQPVMEVFPGGINLLRDISHDVFGWFVSGFVHWPACPLNCVGSGLLM